jgi:hypothetical protein
MKNLYLNPLQSLYKDYINIEGISKKIRRRYEEDTKKIRRRYEEDTKKIRRRYIIMIHQDTTK